jgi:large subunit ribosomal protein L9
MHEVPVLLHPEIEALITINVARSAAEAERQAKGEAFNVVTSMDDLGLGVGAALADAEIAAAISGGFSRMPSVPD